MDENQELQTQIQEGNTGKLSQHAGMKTGKPKPNWN